ncbi:MAG: putative O-glycosylation ligase, exosortase A system-associated [Elioraea sp.]|nr:putative O-glycosylation ligase, exosortase A system-associated [Elioraea sp.]
MLRSIAFSAIVLPLLAVTASGKPFVGVLLWSWVSFMSPHRMMYGFASDIPWAMITFLVTLVGCLMAREPRRLPRDAVSVLLVLFAIGVSLTSLVAISSPERVFARWDKVMKIIAGVLLTRALATDADRIHALLWMMAISLGFYGVRGGGFTLLTGGGNRVLGPRDTMIADRNHLAVALLFVLPLMNHLRLQSKHAIVRLGIVAAMVLTLFAAIGTQSRGALVAFVCAGFVLWLRSRGKILSGLSIGLVGAAVLAFMPESWEERMRSIIDYQDDASAMGRVRIWEASLRIALARPLTGGGFQAMYEQWIVDRYLPGVLARAAHSIWFETLGEHGFIVFAIWLGILIAGFLYAARLVRLGRANPRHAWVETLGRMSQVSLVAYAAGGSFLSLQYWDGYLTLVSLLTAAHQLVAAPAAGRRAVAEGWRRATTTSAVSSPAPAARPAAARSLRTTSWRTRAAP